RLGRRNGFFFFLAEDGIRDLIVTGVQTCALPISATLSGGTQPSGTITFHLYAPGDGSCQTPVSSSSATVARDGAYQASPVALTATGTYRWVAGYGGDRANTAVSGACADRSEEHTSELQSRSDLV